MLQLFEYELPFRSVFKTGSSEFKTRKGVLIHYCENNIDFVSEVSPLPGFSRETFRAVQQSLLSQKRWIEDFLREDFTIQNIRDLNEVSELNLPSIQYGLSFLSLSILANRRGKSIYHLFKKKPPQEILINDVIGHASVQQMKNQILTSIKNGFKVLKIKAPYPLDELLPLLNSIQKDHPGVHFRLDANQSWPRTELSDLF